MYICTKINTGMYIYNCTASSAYSFCIKEVCSCEEFVIAGSVVCSGRTKGSDVVLEMRNVNRSDRRLCSNLITFY